MSNYKIGVNLRVTENSNQGGRKYMEDNHAIRFVKNDEGGFEFAYFGIFDGHGGPEASKFARDHLLDEITKYDCFWSENDEDVLYAIKHGFLDTHYLMWKEVGKWPKTASGHPSTSGTTGSVSIIKNSKLYIGHVGDSGVALGYDDSEYENYMRPKGVMLTVDHKPDSPKEIKRIENSGGQVIAKAGVQRVVWNRPNLNHKGPIRRSTPIDKIPFLAVARSLGDLWSYNYFNEEFVVSPEPDVSVHSLDPTRDKCLIFGSDGLWNMMSAEAAVSMVVDLEYHFEYKVIHDPNVSVSYWINPAEKLVQKALYKWRSKLMKADNTSCIVVLIDPLGPRKLSILKRKRDEYFKKIKDNKSVESIISSPTRTSPRKHETTKQQTDETKTEDEVIKSSYERVCHESVVTVLSPVSTEKSRRHSIPASFNSELDDSIQAASAHIKTSLSTSSCVKDKLNASCSSVLSRLQGTKSENDFKFDSNLNSLPNTRTRHHSSNVLLQDKYQKLSDQNQKPLKNQIFSASSLKDLSVLTDSLKPHQTNKVPVIDKTIRKSYKTTISSACSLKDVQNIFECGKKEIKVRTSNDMNKKVHQKDVTGKLSSFDCLDFGGHYLRRHSTGSTDKRSSIITSRLRKVKQRSLRYRGQMENKEKAIKHKLSGVKRKRNSSDDIPQSKRSCRR